MALIDQVRIRLSAQKIAELTNPDAPNVKVEGTARLTAACTDAKQLFQRFTGTPFDDVNGGPIINGVQSTDHWTIGVPGVLAVLQTYRGLPASEVAERSMSAFKDLCARYMRTFDGAMTWLSPVTDSNLTPTPSPAQRPDFDGVNLEDLVPRSPRTSNQDRLQDNR